MLDDKISIPVEQFETLLKAQTQLTIVKNIIKRYHKQCVGGYVDTLLLHDVLDVDPAELNGGN